MHRFPLTITPLERQMAALQLQFRIVASCHERARCMTFEDQASLVRAWQDYTRAMAELDRQLRAFAGLLGSFRRGRRVHAPGAEPVGGLRRSA